MIRLVEARNFRMLRGNSEALHPFVVLVGQNATGKSTFLGALQLVADVLRHGAPDAVRKLVGSRACAARAGSRPVRTVGSPRGHGGVGPVRHRCGRASGGSVPGAAGPLRGGARRAGTLVALVRRHLAPDGVDVALVCRASPVSRCLLHRGTGERPAPACHADLARIVVPAAQRHAGASRLALADPPRKLEAARRACLSSKQGRLRDRAPRSRGPGARRLAGHGEPRRSVRLRGPRRIVDEPPYDSSIRRRRSSSSSKSWSM